MKNPSVEDWRKAYEQLPENVKETIFEQALTSCPDCGARGVPISWALSAIEAATGMKVTPT